MGRITIFNTISGLLLGAIGAGIGTLFGREAIGCGMAIGYVLGFLFPFYPIVIVTKIVERFTRRDAGHATKRGGEER